VKRLTLVILIVLGAFGLPERARADDVRVVAAVDNPRVYIGDSVTLQITVEGATAAAPPDLANLEGVSAQYVGAQDASSHSVSIINGRMQRQDSIRYVMQWKLTPTRKGAITIPALNVTVDGKSYSTAPLIISAVEPSESPDFRLKLEAEKPSAYVGEPIKVKVTWYLGKQVSGPVQFSGGDGGKVFDIGPGPDPRPGGREDQRYPVLSFLGKAAVGRMGQGDMDGAQVTTVTLELIVTPRRPGEAQVGPYSVAFQEVVGQRAPSFFDAPWDNRTVTERRVVMSNTMTLDVRALPAEGKPAGFSGLIGTYGISASARDKEANVGDPVPLTVKITGPEPMEGVAPPDLAELPGFENFKLAPEGWQEDERATTTGHRAFTTTVRPRTDAVTEIPPVALSFFDPSTGKYSTARSSAIPLKVNPTREVTSADAIGAPRPPVAAAALEPKPGKPMERGPGGIAANYEDESALVNQGVSVIEIAGHPLGALVLAGPPAVCLAVSLARGRRTSASPGARRARAFRRASRRLRRAASHEDVAGALRSYIGGAFGVEPSAVTSADARALLNGKGSALGQQIERLLAECECARFAGAGSTATALELRSQAATLLPELHRDMEVLS
jgi:hypothetical protein